MAWTAKQKMIAATAAEQIGLTDEQRRAILRNVPGHRAMHDGRITSTSARLTNPDFDWYMSVIESEAGGQVPGWKRGYWSGKSADPLARARHLAHRLADLLTAGSDFNVGGWLRHYITADTADTIEALDYRQLYAAIEGMKKIARRRGVRIAA
jgi:hypothetical protein